MSAIKFPVRDDLLGILVKILSISVAVADVSVNVVDRIMTRKYDQAYILFKNWPVSACVLLLSKLIL